MLGMQNEKLDKHTQTIVDILEVVVSKYTKFLITKNDSILSKRIKLMSLDGNTRIKLCKLTDKAHPNLYLAICHLLNNDTEKAKNCLVLDFNFAVSMSGILDSLECTMSDIREDLKKADWTKVCGFIKSHYRRLLKGKDIILPWNKWYVEGILYRNQSINSAITSRIRDYDKLCEKVIIPDKSHEVSEASEVKLPTEVGEYVEIPPSVYDTKRKSLETGYKHERLLEMLGAVDKIMDISPNWTPYPVCEAREVWVEPKIYDMVELMYLADLHQAEDYDIPDVYIYLGETPITHSIFDTYIPSMFITNVMMVVKDKRTESLLDTIVFKHFIDEDDIVDSKERKLWEARWEKYLDKIEEIESAKADNTPLANEDKEQA
jgi:hypothetical protein